MVIVLGSRIGLARSLICMQQYAEVAVILLGDAAINLVSASATLGGLEIIVINAFHHHHAVRIW